MLHQSSATTLEALSVYKRLLDDAIEQHCQSLLADTGEQFGVYSQDAMEVYVSLLRRGGKRLRGALAMNSYTMLGGTDKDLILQAARAIEMLHAYILIIDDVQDRSYMRRGSASAHIGLQRYHMDRQLHGDSAHFGVSVALGAAFVGGHLAMREITQLKADPAVKVQVIDLLNETMAITGHGQINDIVNEAVQAVDEAQIHRTLTWKTAYYTFLNPLHVGALLAGASHQDRALLHEYSTHMGLAFQITDDILGTFGNEFESGKSAADDIKEGKITLLVSHALHKATPEQKSMLLRNLGNDSLTDQQLDLCRTIITDTGALDYANRLAREHANFAAVSLRRTPKHWRKSGVDFLTGLTDYVTSRTA